MSFRAVIERRADQRLVYVSDLPGCWVSAHSVEVAVAAAEAAIPDYMRWLRAHHIDVPHDGDLELGILEEGEYQGRIGPFFSTDLHAPNEEQFELALVVGAAARDDLVQLYLEASPQQQVYKYSAAEHSPRDILFEVAERDIWFAQRLEDIFTRTPKITLGEDPVEAVMSACIHIEYRMKHVFDLAASRKFERDGEDWSLTKVIRRRTAYLRQRHADMLLAVRQRILPDDPPAQDTP